MRNPYNLRGGELLTDEETAARDAELSWCGYALAFTLLALFLAMIGGVIFVMGGVLGVLYYGIKGVIGMGC